MNKLRTFLISLAVLLSASVPTFAQTATTQTTLSAAMTIGATSMSLSSGTNIAAGAEIVIDSEDFIVISASSTTAPVVLRGQNGTATAAHASSAIVWVGAAITAGSPNSPFIDGSPASAGQGPSGTCVATAQPFAPLINRRTGDVWNCKNSTWQIYTFQQAGETFSRTPLANVSYTALLSDYLIAYSSVTAPLVLTLPSATGLAGHVIVVKDETGSVNSLRTITIIGTINGRYQLSQTSPWFILKLYSDGFQFFTW